MRFLTFLYCIIPINALVSPVSIRRYSRNINGYPIKVFEPKNINKKNTHSLLFFTGGNSLISSEIYTDFLSKLANQQLSVYVAPSNLEQVEDVMDTITDEYLDVTNVGHSSGAVNALLTANKNKQVTRSVLLDPVDSDKLFKSFNLQNRIPFLSKSAKKLNFKYLKDLLVINAKKSYEWKLIPLTIPFVPAFKMNLDEITKNNVNINLIEAENFGHSDILNPFWGEIMHKTISKGSEDRNEELLDNYHQWLASTIHKFVFQHEVLVSPAPESPSSEELETQNI